MNKSEHSLPVKHFLAMVDFISEWGGRIGCLCLAVLQVVVVYEVVMRFVFNSPTDWGFEVANFMLFGIATLVAGYVSSHNAHINVDIVYGNLSVRNKAIVDLITAPLLFGFIIIFLFESCSQAIESVIMGERSESVWAPVVYPMKIVLVIGGFLIFIQGIAKFIKDLNTVTKQSSPDR